MKPVFFRKIKNRIISKSVFTFFFISYLPLYRTSGRYYISVRHNAGDDTYEPCTSLHAPGILKKLYDMIVFYGVRSIFTHISCRIYSRCLIKIINFKSRIIGYNDSACDVGYRFCLNNGIFLKCISILNDFNIRKSLVFKRYKLNIISFYYLSYFFHFIFIACGNYNFCHPRFFLLLISLRVFIIPL